jgi:hypothetical protein
MIRSSWSVGRRCRKKEFGQKVQGRDIRFNENLKKKNNWPFVLILSRFIILFMFSTCIHTYVHGLNWTRILLFECNFSDRHLSYHESFSLVFLILATNPYLLTLTTKCIQSKNFHWKTNKQKTLVSPSYIFIDVPNFTYIQPILTFKTHYEQKLSLNNSRHVGNAANEVKLVVITVHLRL